MGRRPRFTTPLTRARDLLVRYLIWPLYAFSPRVRLLISCTALVALTTLLLFTNDSSLLPSNSKEGDVVKSTIVSPADITTVDVAQTKLRQEAAREATRPIYKYDPTRSESSAESFRAAWEELRDKSEGHLAKSPSWNGEGGQAVASAIIAHRFDRDLLNTLLISIREASAGYIYDDHDPQYLKQEIELVDVGNSAAQVIVRSPITQANWHSLSSVTRNLELRIRGVNGLTLEQKTAFASAIAPLIKPNVVLDQTATATAREAEAAKVPPVGISLKRNQVIAREGDTITPTMLTQFDAIQGSGRRGRPLQKLIGLLLIVTAVYWATWKFS